MMPRSADRARGERHQRQRTALPVVVGAQEDQHVFQRDDDDQRPQDEREHAEHGVPRKLAAAAGSGYRRFAQGVERARADVAIDDTDAAERETPRASAGTLLAAAVRGQVARQGRRQAVGHGFRGKDAACSLGAAASASDAGPGLYTLCAAKSCSAPA
jgi:hypothetical protein